MESMIYPRKALESDIRRLFAEGRVICDAVAANLAQKYELTPRQLFNVVRKITRNMAPDNSVGATKSPDFEIAA
jgi:hypothetical protein